MRGVEAGRAQYRRGARGRSGVSRRLLPRASADARSNVPILADFSANLMRDMEVALDKELLVALPPASLHVFGPRPPFFEALAGERRGQP